MGYRYVSSLGSKAHGPGAWAGHGLGLLLVALSWTLSPRPALAQTRDGIVGERGGEVRPGDLIQLRIWREPDLSDTVRVSNEGVAVFPKLGPIPVTTLSPDSLQRLLVASYSRYLQNPSIDVSVRRRITIWGSVNRPGPVDVDQTMTITDALSLAGGASQDGKSDKVELRRGGERTVLDLTGNPKIWETPLRSGDQLYVPQRSWLSRNAGFALGVVGTVTSLLFLVVD